MAPVFFVACLFLVTVTVVNGQGAFCPVCTNKYNHESCTGVQQCRTFGDICSLVVHTSDSYSVDYVCKPLMECSTLEIEGCHPTVNETCYYCCDDVVTCKIQRDDLFNYEFPSQATHPPASTQTSTATVGPSASGPDTGPVFTTSVPTPPTTYAPVSCVECGNFALGTPCTETELLLNQPVTCPAGLPYCFETVNLIGGNFRVIKGCAEHNFCRLEWDISHSVPGCHPLDLAIGDIACTYCCSGSLCNAVVPPDPNDQVMFPDDR